MSVLPIVMLPGVYKEDSAYNAKGRWIDANNVRWWKGQPELIGGCEQFLSDTMDSAPRGVHAWRTLDGELLMAWGTQNKLWLYHDGILYDITPVGLPAGDGSADELVGPWDDTDSGYGDIYYGGSAPLLLSPAGARTWSLVNYGEDLISNYFGGALYIFDVSTSLADPEANPAVIMSEAPETANGIFVSKQARHLVAIGAHDGTDPDALNVRWSQRENIVAAGSWDAGATSTAGSNRVESGGRLVQSIGTRLGELLLTDFSAHLMRWIGSPNHFAIDDMGTNCGAISPKCGVDMGGVAYWMGFNGFFKFDGSVQEVPCDVQKFVFESMNRAEIFKIYAGVNTRFSEVVWFYPQDGNENDRFVAYNVKENHWSIGNAWERTSWIDSNVLTQVPVATDASGVIYLHETGTTINGAQLPYFMESAEIEYENGNTFGHIRKMIPDYERVSGDHNLYLIARPYPQRDEKTKGPYTINSSTGKRSVRVRGRSVRLRMESGAGETDFRWGQWRADGRLHGKRA